MQHVPPSSRFRSRCHRCEDLLDDADREICPCCGLPGRTIGAGSLALGALLHIILTLIVLLASTWLVLSSGPDDPDGLMKDMVADGLMIVVLLPDFSSTSWRPALRSRSPSAQLDAAPGCLSSWPWPGRLQR